MSDADLRRIEEEASSADHTLRPGKWGWRIELLVGNGVLSDEDVHRLERKISTHPSAPPSRPGLRHPSSHGPDSGLTAPSARSRKSFPEIPAEWDRYEVVELIGEGGMGRVYRAIDPRLRRWVALKFLHGDDPDLVQRFLGEARTQASVEHDNVCPIYEVGEVEGRPYIAMQLIRGESLADCAAKLSMEERLRLVRDVALALHAAHEHGLVHRDVKPANILVERDAGGQIKPYVVDFGLAREVEAPSITVTGAILGTVAYMAPEQAGAGNASVDHRADIYSLGATLYDALAGRPPYTGSSLEVLVKLAGEDPTPLSRALPGVPRDVEAIVMKCLRRDPEDRYATARELAEDLDRYLAGEPVRARPVTAVDRGRSWIRRNRLAAVALGALLVTVLASAAWVGVSTWRSSRQTYYARTFLQETSRIERRVRMMTARPLHDTTAEVAELRRHLQTLEEQVQASGGAARGPGEYALG
ncbi:MAG TPA: serine/threonine protein kinase, partial [Acidobacteria bacterium]|nr:serine/threonine protein kinase [Acidobacteriota bacterium]